MTSTVNQKPTMALTSLPSEILHLVVQLGSFENTLALSRVCTVFYTICQNPLTYRAIIKNGNGITRADLPKNLRRDQREAFLDPPTDWLMRAGLHQENDGKKMAKWACANSKAISYALPSLPEDSGNEDPAPSTEEPPETRNSRIHRLRWLPEIFIAGHPLSSRLCSTLLPNLSGTLRVAGLVESEDLEWRATFVCAYILLHRSDFEINDLAGGDLAMPTNSTSRPISDKLDVALPSAGTVRASHVKANLAIGRFRTHLKHYLATTHSFLQRYNLAPPSAEQIPLSSLNEIRAPFSTEGQDLIRHLTVMATKEWLEDGEWVGYYDHSLSGAIGHFDPMMTGIRFRAEREGRIDLRLISVTGRDAVGDFQLEGSLVTGIIRMEKRYSQGIVWQWKAVLTTFGIVGTWGQTGWGGWVWLWKREWSP